MNIKTKKAKLIILVIAAITAVAIGCTAAFVTEKGTTHNVITSGGITIRLIEITKEVDEYGNPIPYKDVDGILPGDSISKIPLIENVDSDPCWVRMSVSSKIQLANGEVVAADDDVLQIDFNNEDWQLSDDGYYYYPQYLEPGERTEPLFTTVVFSPDLGNEYEDSKIIVDVSAEATQYYENGNSVTEAVGWPDTGDYVFD